MIMPRMQAENIGFNYIKNKSECFSPFGTELLHCIAPFVDLSQLNAEFDRIESAKNALQAMPDECAKLCHSFMLLKDIRRTVISCRDTTLDEVSLFELRRFLLLLATLTPTYSKIAESCNISELLPDCSKALSVVNPENSENATFYIADSYSVTLSHLRSEKRDIERRIRDAATMQQKDELLNARTEIVASEAAEEYRIRSEMTQKLIPHIDSIIAATETIARIDFALSKARLAIEYGATRPKITSDDSIILKQMRNPEIADRLEKSGSKYTATSISIVRTTNLITGANMGGKSVALKTIALNVYLAMCGFFVFCDELELPFIDNVMMISEDYEDKSRGLSSFGGEIVALLSTLSKLTDNTLLLIDEFARGTNPEEGKKLACLLVAYMNTKRCFTVLTTHFDGVSEYSATHFRVAGISHSDLETLSLNADIFEQLAKLMDYTLLDVTGRTDVDIPKDAMNICRILAKNTEFFDFISNTIID